MSSGIGCLRGTRPKTSAPTPGRGCRRPVAACERMAAQAIVEWTGQREPRPAARVIVDV